MAVMDDTILIINDSEDEEMGQVVNSAVDKAMLDILSKVALDAEQDAYVRFVLRNLYLEAYDEGAEEGYYEGLEETQFKDFEGE